MPAVARAELRLVKAEAKACTRWGRASFAWLSRFFCSFVLVLAPPVWHKATLGKRGAMLLLSLVPHQLGGDRVAQVRSLKSWNEAYTATNE